MKGLTATYQFEKGPLATDWETYAREASSAYAKLIDGNPHEKQVQSFFEMNPAFVPGAWGPGAKAGHYPHPLALITQPILSGFTERVPDFMWIATDSACWYPVLIEIERPSKRIFRSNSTTPHADFTEARNQLIQWKTWIRNPANQQVFEQRLGVPELLLGRQMRPHFVLIYGRRAEFDGHRERTRHRANLIDTPDEELISFDRLEPDAKCSDMLTVRSKSDGRFSAVAVPPTLVMRPDFARELHMIGGLEEAIGRCERMSAQRQEFLISRLPYWRNWASNDDNGLTTGGYE